MDILFLIGRVIFGAYWLMNAFNHFKNIDGMTGYAASKSIPAPKIAVIASGVLLVIGGASIILGFYPMIGIVALLVFLVPVTFKMHAFWTIQDPMAKMGEMINFNKNVALIGALLIMMAIAQPWTYSL